MNIQDKMQEIHHKYGVSEKANYEIQLFVEYLIKKDRAEQLNLSGVSQCNELSKPKVSSKTILLINRKDGLTDLYTDDGCLGVGLNNEEVKKITGVSYCG